ncbi:hypothetical protein S101447_01832 [Acetobacter ascendens]|uniref:Uncharacterized protein n=1 Tax=Acetobacter ascendens TaxID=481146 RepID=A0A1Y0UZA5_9PROT|nr:hypothetical protein S101447_01832 [Acetobacter ascendens]
MMTMCRAGGGEAERGQKRERKIKAVGTPWVRSVGQALVCTLFWMAPLLRGYGAATGGEVSFRLVFRGTLGCLWQFRVDQRP